MADPIGREGGGAGATRWVDDVALAGLLGVLPANVDVDLGAAALEVVAIDLTDRAGSDDEGAHDCSGRWLR